MKESDSKKIGFAESIAQLMQEVLLFPRSMHQRWLHSRSFFIAVLAVCVGFTASAQVPAPDLQIASAALPDAPQPQASQTASGYQPDEVTVRNSMHIFWHDEEGIWTSPARLRPHNLVWLAPLALATGAAIATDHRFQSEVVSHDVNFNNANLSASNGLVGGMIAVPIAVFAAGEFKQNDHAREAGILGGEAMADGLIVCEASKLVFRRERPDVDQSRGRFFQSSAGIDGSFFSLHTTIAFAAASTVAGEYPSPWVQVAAYAGATAVGVTRVLGRQHFPSDVLVGATAGWLIGHYVLNHHHRKTGRGR